MGQFHVLTVFLPAMEEMTLTILGCGSALPTSMHMLSAQVLSVGNKLYLIDCGEGTQLQYRKLGLSFMRLRVIFISHLHGDHCFGLPGLLSTFSLLGRRAGLSVYLPDDAADVMRSVVESLCGELPYPVSFCPFDPHAHQVIYEDRSITVTSLPLMHRVSCGGFLFREKQGLRHLNRAECDWRGIPISYFDRLKRGADYVDADGNVVPNDVLTTPADPARSFAYCSDTAYLPALAGQVRGVDLLYHEATFAECDAVRARETFHSTARQAATIARDAGVRRLLIGHYSARYKDLTPLLDEARSVFGETLLSHEGLNLAIK